jgi:hypothetical protein
VIYTSGVDNEGNLIGLPYGPMARILLIWINSHAFTQHSRRIKVTSHLYEFLREIGMPITTGKRPPEVSDRVTSNAFLKPLRVSISAVQTTLDALQREAIKMNCLFHIRMTRTMLKPEPDIASLK